MADLHEALKSLAPTQWTDVPLDDLPTYLSNAFTASELICNSVPPPPNGEPFHASRPHHKRPNAAKSAKEMHPSAARPHPPHKHHEGLQSSWGKPLKVNAKENPLNVAVYKMAGHDRHGAWFARRSVHEGLGFTKFKRAMQREFPHSLTVQGGPGAGAVRGLAADRRVERREVDGVGKVEVYELSAQFPGPVSPRDFLTLLLTTDDALTEKTVGEGTEEVAEGEAKKYMPRHYMIVSKPLQHPDAPERAGFVRGQYESVELIREIPLHQAKSKSTPNLLSSQADSSNHARDRSTTLSFAESRGSDAKGEQVDLHPASSSDHAHDPELNPVEWIMITRSDPGGGIPRFLVERGTPEAMLADVLKFLNWATGMDTVPDADEDLEVQEGASEAQRRESMTPALTASTPALNGETQPTDSSEHTRAPVLRRISTEPLPTQRTLQQQQEANSGVMQTTLQAIEAGISAYAPTAVSNQVHHYLHPSSSTQDDIHDDDNDSDSSSISSSDSFMSAAELRRLSTAPEQPLNYLDGAKAAESTENLSLKSRASSELSRQDKKNLSPHEKEVQKLMKEREKLDRKLAKKRAEEESKLQKLQEKEKGEQDKTRSKHERELQKAEEKHRKEVEKLQQRKEKELQKAEEKRRKKDVDARLSAVSRERDEFRSQLDSYKRENGLLVERVEELQRENTVLAARLGKTGPEALKGIDDEVEGLRKRAVSGSSSKKSGESGGRAGSKESLGV